jgi:alkyl hydroperoxide reductase subunit AhpC
MICMVELGELEANHAEFEERGTRVVVISMEDCAKAEATQADFPHLKVVADGDARMCRALEVIHPGIAPDGSDAAAPTTILVDGKGKVRWLFRPERHMTRLSTAELLKAIDEHLLGS